MFPPIRPLPVPLRANEVGTFTEDSVIRRLPEIARRTNAGNGFPGLQSNRIEALATEIGTGVIVHIDEPAASDAAAWAAQVHPYLGMSWIDVPWFFAETYFYRRLLAAAGYSQSGPRKGNDPFLYEKRIGLDSAVGLAAVLGDNLDDAPSLLAASLWANRVDMSLWAAGDAGSDERVAAVLGDGDSNLLADDRAQAVAALDKSGAHVHFVLDNAGAELVADLALMTHVLGRGGHVTINAKPHPTFVSDVTPPDLYETIERLQNEQTAAKRIGKAVASGIDNGTVTVATHPFWVSPSPFWLCPDDLVGQIGAADLIVVKGDANYRRLLGDSHWEPTTPFTDIVRPPAPLVALRTSKAEVIAGLSQEMIDRAGSSDSDWMYSGDWGVIQFAPKVVAT